VLTYVYELMKFRVVFVHRAKPVDQLRRDGGRVSPDMIEELRWPLEDGQEHGLVLEILVRDVDPRSPDVKAIVYDTTHRPPDLAVFLGLPS